MSERQNLPQAQSNIAEQQTIIQKFHDQQATPDIFDGWLNRHDFHPIRVPNSYSNGLNYYMYLRGLIDEACANGENVSEKVLPKDPKAAEQYSLIINAPSRLEEFANAKNSTPKYKESLLTLASVWRSSLRPETRQQFLETRVDLPPRLPPVAEPAIQQTEVAYDYDLLLSALRNVPPAVSGVDLELIVPPAQHIKLIDFVP